MRRDADTPSDPDHVLSVAGVKEFVETATNDRRQCLIGVLARSRCVLGAPAPSRFEPAANRTRDAKEPVGAPPCRHSAPGARSRTLHRRRCAEPRPSREPASALSRGRTRSRPGCKAVLPGIAEPSTAHPVRSALDTRGDAIAEDPSIARQALAAQAEVTGSLRKCTRRVQRTRAAALRRGEWPIASSPVKSVTKPPCRPRPIPRVHPAIRIRQDGSCPADGADAGSVSDPLLLRPHRVRYGTTHACTDERLAVPLSASMEVVSTMPTC